MTHTHAGRAEISTLATPSVANNSARARCTTRNGNVCDRAKVSNTSRCPSDTTNASAARPMNHILHTCKTIYGTLH